jgi:hypothetical protein
LPVFGTTKDPEANMSRLSTTFQTGKCFSNLAERRAWVRYPCDLDSSCRPVVAAPNRRWPAKVRNVSSGGICMSLDRRFEPGALLTIEIQRTGAGQSFTFVGRVIHVSRDGGGWLLGCAFRSALSEDEIQALL